MKKVIEIVATVMILLMSVIFFTSCTSSVLAGDRDENINANAVTKVEAKKDEKIRIGFSLPSQYEERWVKDRQNIEEECKKLGIELIVQIANEDIARQEAQCENMISRGIKVLILAPHDIESAAAIVDKAHNAGVKVISYDKLVRGTVVDVYISFDNVKVGEIQGKWLIDNVEEGNIAMLYGAPTDDSAKLLMEGAMKYIEPKVDSGDYKVVMQQPCIDCEPDHAMKHMEDALVATENNIQGVLAYNDDISGGCIEALSAYGLAGKVPITGQGAELAAARRIIEGTQGMTVFKDTRELGKVAVETAVKMAKGEDLAINSKVNNDKIDVPSLLLTPVAVDKENIDKILIDSGYLKKDDVYVSYRQ